MHPIAFYIGSFAVHWYGVFIGIGFLVSFRLLLSLKKYASLTTDQIYNISMIALFAGSKESVIMRFSFRQGR